MISTFCLAKFSHFLKLLTYVKDFSYFSFWATSPRLFLLGPFGFDW